MNESELLFTQILNCKRQDLYLKRDRHLDKKSLEFISQVFKERVSGKPLQYILGKTEFMGLEFKVIGGVFIPRPETEILVETAIKTIKSQRHKTQVTRILDIGTGSGCIAISLAKLLPDTEVTAIDISPVALRAARENAELNNVNINFIQGDLYIRGENSAPLRRAPACRTGRDEQLSRSVFRFGKPRASARGASFYTYDLQLTTYDLIVSNPPYIPTSEIEGLAREVRYEPRIALDGGMDGLNFYRRIIKDSPAYLEDNGYLFLEMGFTQRKAIEKIVDTSRIFSIVRVVRDYNNIERVVVLKKNGS